MFLSKNVVVLLVFLILEYIMGSYVMARDVFWCIANCVLNVAKKPTSVLILLLQLSGATGNNPFCSHTSPGSSETHMC